MRKINAIIALIVSVLFVDHLIFGSLQTLGKDVQVFRPAAYLMVGLALVHGIISMILSKKSLDSARKTKAPYLKENSEFLWRRISGIAILILVPLHIFLMWRDPDGIPRIEKVGPLKIVNLLLPLMLCVHLYCNIKPLLISFGFKTRKITVWIIRIIVIGLSAFALYANIARMIMEVSAG